jgi:hypothetical protein
VTSAHIGRRHTPDQVAEPGFQDLESLDLSGNQIETLTIENVPRLREISLSQDTLPRLVLDLQAPYTRVDLDLFTWSVPTPGVAWITLTTPLPPGRELTIHIRDFGTYSGMEERLSPYLRQNHPDLRGVTLEVSRPTNQVQGLLAARSSAWWPRIVMPQPASAASSGGGYIVALLQGMPEGNSRQQALAAYEQLDLLRQDGNNDEAEHIRMLFSQFGQSATVRATWPELDQNLPNRVANLLIELDRGGPRLRQHAIEPMLETACVDRAVCELSELEFRVAVGHSAWGPSANTATLIDLLRQQRTRQQLAEFVSITYRSPADGLDESIEAYLFLLRQLAQRLELTAAVPHTMQFETIAARQMGYASNANYRVRGSYDITRLGNVAQAIRSRVSGPLSGYLSVTLVWHQHLVELDRPGYNVGLQAIEDDYSGRLDALLDEAGADQGSRLIALAHERDTALTRYIAEETERLLRQVAEDTPSQLTMDSDGA